MVEKVNIVDPIGNVSSFKAGQGLISVHCRGNTEISKSRIKTFLFCYKKLLTG